MKSLSFVLTTWSVLAKKRQVDDHSFLVTKFLFVATTEKFTKKKPVTYAERSLAVDERSVTVFFQGRIRQPMGSGRGGVITILKKSGATTINAGGGESKY